MSIQFSRGLTLVGGLVLPVLETARRWHQLGDWHNWAYWLDDWTIGGMPLMGFWMTRKDLAHGRPYLAAAWGFACAGASDSFMYQIAYTGGDADPSGASQAVVVAAKAVMLALSVTALVLTLRWKPADA